MKSIVSVILLAFLLHVAFAANSTVAPSQQKTCADFLPADTCDKLQKLIISLKESATTLQDAINSAVEHHKTKTNEVLIFVREYIAERVQCDKVLPSSVCQRITAIATKLKLTKLQVQTAIEQAVQDGAKTAADIYKKVITFLTNDITCAKIFSEMDCKRISDAIDKFHEQRSLLKEAIMSIAMKNYNTTTSMLKDVQEYVVSKVVNFKCEDAMPAMMCTKLNDLGKRVKLLPSQILHAIEMAYITGYTTATGIYNDAIVYMTNEITCEKILTPTACQNFMEAAKKLHEQRTIIQEALMSAAQKHYTNVVDIVKEVKDQLVASALNFDCTDVLPEQKCTLLFNIAKNFKLRASEVQRILVEAIVNGISSGQKLYQATIGGLIADAKDLQCEDVIDPNRCQFLKDFAKKIGIRVSVVTEAVKEAIVAGKSNVKDIIDFAKNIIVDEASCNDFFTGIVGKITCRGLQTAAFVKGITFDKVVDKIRELYASGVTLRNQIIDEIRKFFDINKSKRSIEENDQVSVKDELVDLGLQIISGLMSLTEKAKNLVKKELTDLYEQGKLRLTNVNQIVKGIQNKVQGMMGDEIKGTSEVDLYVNAIKEKLKVIKEKAEKELKEKLQWFRKLYEKIITKIVTYRQEDDLEDSMKQLESMVHDSVEEQFDEALKSFL